MTELPAGWEAPVLSDIATSHRKSAHLENDLTYELWSIPSFADGAPEVVTGTEMKSGKLSVQPDDVLISKINPRINRVWLVGEHRGWPQVASTEWIVARIGDHQRVRPQYLKAYCTSPEFRSAITANVSGVTGSHTRAKPAEVMALTVPLPPSDEQDEIVRILDTQLARLDTVMGAVQAVRDKAEQFRRSLLHAAFTGQLTQPDPTRGVVLPVDWAQQVIGDFALVRGGKRLPKGTPWSSTRTDHPYIRATDINHGRVDQSELVYVVDEIWSQISKYVVEAGDLIITIAGTIGRVAKVPASLVGANLTENAARITIQSEQVSESFLSHFLQSPGGQMQISSRTRATSQSKLALERIRTIDVPIPPISEQAEILEALDTQLARLDGVLGVADRVEAECGRLRRSLLQAAFSGELTKKWREANG